MANNIKQLREAAGMTQAELAAKMRLTTPSITKWELGRANPTYDNLIQLAEIFGVTVVKVTTTTVHGKQKRTGRYPAGFAKTWKKAVVKLSEDSKNIEIFEGMA